MGSEVELSCARACKAKASTIVKKSMVGMRRNTGDGSDKYI